MRAVGQSVTRIDHQLASKITVIATLYSSSAKIEAGTYHLQVLQAQDRSFQARLKRLPDSGGAHDQFWRCFYSFLEDLSNTVSRANEPDATALVAEVSALQLILAANGLTSGTWLSSVRNRINYQHELGVWFPYGAGTTAIDVISGFSPLTEVRQRLDHNASSHPIEAFASCCREISATNISLSNALRQRGKTKRFNQLWERLISEC
jgi:hypothetical protein